MHDVRFEVEIDGGSSWEPREPKLKSRFYGKDEFPTDEFRPRTYVKGGGSMGYTSRSSTSRHTTLSNSKRTDFEFEELFRDIDVMVGGQRRTARVNTQTGEICSISGVGRVEHYSPIKQFKKVVTSLFIATAVICVFLSWILLDELLLAPAIVLGLCVASLHWGPGYLKKRKERADAAGDAPARDV